MRQSYANRLATHQENLGNATPSNPHIFQTNHGIHNYVGIYNGLSDWAYITRDGSEVAPHRIYNLPCIKTIADAEIVYLNLDRNGNRRAKVSVNSANLGFLKFDEICQIMKSMGWRYREGYFYGQCASGHAFITEYVNRAINGV